jgi:hypothetical protein
MDKATHVTPYSPQTIATIRKRLDRALEAELDRLPFANPAHQEARYSAGVAGVQCGGRAYYASTARACPPFSLPPDLCRSDNGSSRP